MKITSVKFVFLAFLALLGFSGCIKYRVEISDPNQQMILLNGDDSAVLPQANPDPARIVAPAPMPPVKPKSPQPPPMEPPAGVKTEIPTAAVKTLPPAPVAPTEPAKPTVPPVANSEPPKVHPAPTPHGGSFRRSPWLWRAFTRAPKEEQQELLKLQRTDPDRYRAVIQEKANALYALEKAKRDAIDALAAQYRAGTTQEEKNALREELRRRLREDFQQRLQDIRGDIESYKRRTAMLEAELQKREQNCEAIVDALLNSKLTAPEAK